jgi:hypothetical protein
MAETDVIRTPDQRLRVFVSSTLQELAAERQAVRDAVTRLRLVPVMFELGARLRRGAACAPAGAPRWGTRRAAAHGDFGRRPAVRLPHSGL